MNEYYKWNAIFPALISLGKNEMEVHHFSLYLLNVIILFRSKKTTTYITLPCTASIFHLCFFFHLTLFLVVLFTFYDKLYVWRIPVLQFVIAVAHDVEEDPFKLYSKKGIKKINNSKIPCDNFSLLRNEKLTFSFSTEIWFCRLLLSVWVCVFFYLRCVRTRLLFYIVYFDRAKLFGVYAIHSQFIYYYYCYYSRRIREWTKKRQKTTKWGDLLNMCCVVLKYRAC